MSGRDRPSTTVSWPAMGDTRETAAGPTPARWPKPQLAPQRPRKLGQNPIGVIAQRLRSFAADTIRDGNAQTPAIRRRLGERAKSTRSGRSLQSI